MAAHPFVIVPSLTAIAVAYPQGKLIADQVLPRVSVDTESFRYLKYGQGDAFMAPDTRVGRKSAPNQIDWASTELTATVEDHALDTPVPNADVEAYERAMAAGPGMVSGTDPLGHATVMVTETVQNSREVRAANLVFNAASYGANNKVTLSTTGQWSDYANSDPLPAIEDRLDSMLVRPNIAVFGRRTFSKLRRHPKVCKAIFGNNTDAGRVALRQLADELELDEIFVGDGYVNIAKPGQPASMVRCWGNHAAFLVRNKTANTKSGVTFGYTAQYGPKVAGVILDPDIGMRGGQRVRSGESLKELITADDLGFFFQNAVAAA